MVGLCTERVVFTSIDIELLPCVEPEIFVLSKLGHTRLDQGHVCWRKALGGGRMIEVVYVEEDGTGVDAAQSLIQGGCRRNFRAVYER